jgi:hypothetical protein
LSIEIVQGAAAQANVVSLPANLLLYGPPGSGKTTDAVQAFTVDGRCTAFAIPCEDGALKIIAARGLPVPDHPKYTVKTWGQMVETIAWLANNRQHYRAVIIDTVSTLTSNMYKDLEAQNAGTKNKFLTPLAMRAMLYQLREWIRLLGLHSVFIAHAMPPAVKDNVFYTGGPLMAPKTMIEDYHGQLDSVLRVDYVTPLGRPPMRVYWTGGEVWPQELQPMQPPGDWRAWRAKNREGVAQMIVPADLGAFLRARQPPYVGL